MAFVAFAAFNDLTLSFPLEVSLKGFQTYISEIQNSEYFIKDVDIQYEKLVNMQAAISATTINGQTPQICLERAILLYYKITDFPPNKKQKTIVLFLMNWFASISYLDDNKYTRALRSDPEKNGIRLVYSNDKSWHDLAKDLTKHNKLTIRTCGLCKSPASHKCSKCLSIWYCCREHQKEHWKEHKKECCK